MRETITMREWEYGILLPQNDKVFLSGFLGQKWQFAYENKGKRYNKSLMVVERPDGNLDEVPIVVPEKTSELVEKFDYFGLCGTVKTWNNHSFGTNRLEVYVFGIYIDVHDVWTNRNSVFLEGNLCKAPRYKITQNGGVTDFILAVNPSPKARPAYIPCVAWKQDAWDIASLPVGARIRVKGHFRSREFWKDEKIHVAHEVSTCCVMV